MTTVKLIISSKKNLTVKYGSNFSAIDKLLNELLEYDKKRNIATQILYIDDSKSMKSTGIAATAAVTRKSCKNIIDKLFKKLQPAYILIFGAQDVIPFQELKNLAKEDGDDMVPTDLPYACDAPYSDDIAAFVGPTRVLGRVPDIPGTSDVDYVKTVINNIIKYKPVAEDKLMNYFAVTASVWTKSTQLSLSSIFGNNTKLKISPPAITGYAASVLKPLTHFYNCHGSALTSKYYGQKGNDYPTAIDSPDLKGKVSFGTIVAAECCYGAQLFSAAEGDSNQLSIANTYLQQGAIAFLGSSNIAYGPSDSQGLADLITQYFIKSILKGASTGRAALEARQKFVTLNGPHLDPYESKTIAQFYLLGDPSLTPIIEKSTGSGSDTVENRRMNLFNKGVDLSMNVASPVLMADDKETVKAATPSDVKNILEQTGFTGKETEYLYSVETKNKQGSSFAKMLTGGKDVTFRVYIKPKDPSVKDYTLLQALVLKEGGGNVLGWRLYHSR